MSGPTVHTPSSASHLEGVLIVGGGYAGLHAARAVASAGRRVTVLDRRDTHDFVTRLAGVAAGNDADDRASHSLSDFQPGVMIGTLAEVGDGSVTLDDGRTLTADAVVICTGARPTRPPVEGIEHALTLRSAHDARDIRDAVRTATSLVVIGGGATGVQLAAEAAHRNPDMDIHLVEAGPRLLAPMTSTTAGGAERILTARGVEVHLGSMVERITATGVDVAAPSDDDSADGVHYPGTVVWAGGFEARADHLGVDVSDDGRIVVDDDLRVAGMERTFAAGDIAAHVGGAGDPLPMSAQIAVQAGVAAGENAARLLDGRVTTTPSLVQRGWVLDLGGHRGLAEFGPIKLSAPFADLIPAVLHRAIDLRTLFGMGGLRALTW